VPALPSPVLRALEGLAEGSGRTVAIAGPPMSGKSALLEEIRGLLRSRSARIVELRGSYRARSVPYGGLDGLRTDSAVPGVEAGGKDDAENAGEGELEAVPITAIPYLSERLPRSRRSRAGTPRSTFLGQPVRSRSANEGDPDSYWREILPEMRGPHAHPVAILIEDGALFDTESREFIVSLSKRARLRPLLILIALDTSVAGFVTWEEAFLGRGDVDWVRFSESAPDPREAHRLKGIYDDLPSVSQRVAGYVSLLGGTVGEVVLSRVARLTFPQLAEAVLPATGVGLLKVQDGKVTIPHPAWITLTADLIPDKLRREMHLEIANALSALSPEPSLARRIEVARHYLAWFPGPMALRNLLESAEISLQLLAYDAAEELLAQAIACLTSLPPVERDAIEPELRLLHARALFSSGRITEAESEVREGLNGAIRVRTTSETLSEWIEPLLLIMRVVGPRPSLSTTLLDLIERCHDAEMLEVEVLFEALVAEFHSERNWPEKARAESNRAALLARKIPDGHLQALALLAVAVSRIEGNAEEQALAERFLAAARSLLTRARRWELDAFAEDLEASLLQARGDALRAREIRERSVPTLQRMRLLPLELYQQLGIAEIQLDRANRRGAETALQRAHTIAETLHLLPPSPALFRLWLLEGRLHAVNDNADPARDRWQAIADGSGSTTIPRLRSEATVRLALLEYGRDPDVARDLVVQLKNSEVEDALPAGWRAWVGDLERLAAASENGGGRLPPTPEPEKKAPASERRERARREAVGDRGRAHDR
jgi:AAA ATPase domain